MSTELESFGIVIRWRPTSLSIQALQSTSNTRGETRFCGFTRRLPSEGTSLGRVAVEPSGDAAGAVEAEESTDQLHVPTVS